MINTSSLPATLALKLVTTKRESFETSIRKDVVNAREIKAFEERIASISSVEDLVKDYEVYAFVMKAHGLENQIFGKAMMKKVLVSDPAEKGALVNRLTDKRFRDIRNALEFGSDGSAPEKFQDPDWRSGLVQKYVSHKLVESQLESNAPVGIALHMQTKAPTITSWFNVLSDTKAQDFFYTALGLPESLKTTDVDKQAATLAKRFDLEKLKDPAELDKLIRRYTALAQVGSSGGGSSNPIVQLVSGGGGNSLTSINLSGLTALRAGKYSS
ncbi:DUF1217 domain-containing protein [Falsigemmobacter faecalis]|uniref:DUF1217 domain-containing protein n=1 Tax=Falsigemmobacter faecalis TaxID=2488730 RepID=A0A3P3DNN9_9RHOB|nr:DUF1217 domain-containing protein [Falsigemmobacter faecalis]RRH75771.1 DUF1217 domain-containing protein [Falsigemmobacter faecalis]